MSSPLQLKIGSKYKNRRGNENIEIAEALKDEKGEVYIYLDSFDRWYLPNGRLVDTRDTDFDLVEEMKPIQFENGYYWVDLRGNLTPAYIFTMGDGVISVKTFGSIFPLHVAETVSYRSTSWPNGTIPASHIKQRIPFPENHEEFPLMRHAIVVTQVLRVERETTVTVDAETRARAIEMVSTGEVDILDEKTEWKILSSTIENSEER